jgi:subfamily B ATP-binding cassette protein MsbA
MYLRLLKFLKPYWGRFLFAIACMLFYSIFSLLSLGTIIPLLERVLGESEIITRQEEAKTINEVEPSPSHTDQSFIIRVRRAADEKMILFLKRYDGWHLLVVIAIALIIFTFLGGLCAFGRDYFMFYTAEGVAMDIRSILHERLQSFSLDYFTSHRTGMLISRLTNDVKLIESSISLALANLLQQSFQVVIFLTAIFIFIPWQLALLSAITAPLIALPIVRIGRKIRHISARSQEKMADIYSFIGETIFGAPIIRAFSMENYKINKFRSENKEFFNVIMKLAKRQTGLSPMIRLIATLGGVTIILYGGWLVLEGALSSALFIFFLLLFASLTTPFAKLSNVNAMIQQGLAAAGRIFKIIDIHPTVKNAPDAVPLPKIKNKIRFSKVSFSYNDREEVLKDIDIEVKAGETVALVGPTGSGKTTLVNLIPRFYDPTSGIIEIDDCNIKKVTIESLREQIGIVTQETILFNDTIYNNITCNMKDISPRRVEQAARIANAHQFITKMPEGYQTLVGDRGMKLSGGEKQRIAIARAILKDSPILILDEATSALDTESEKLVQDALRKLMTNRTTFIVAHRLSTLRDADRIIVLEEGRIIATGKHEELALKDGLYKKLYETQFLQ